MQLTAVNESSGPSPSQAQSPGLGHWLTLLLLFGAATVVRFQCLACKPFWFDEAFSVEVARIDWRNFLQGLVTQDVETLRPGELRFGGLLTPQGKLLFDLFLFGRDQGCLIDVAADRREALIQRLMLYRLRAKVEIKPDDGVVLAAWQAPAPHGEGWAGDLSPAFDHRRCGSG